jgi:type II secretory pathway pseudopilin PulG
VKTVLVVVLVIVVLLLIAAAVAVPAMRRRRLQQRFGREYERTLESAGDRREAEQDLQQRTQRRKELEIRPLDPVARDGYAQQWRSTQERFVDDPNEAVDDADSLVQQVMRDRGYPVGNFDQQARDISVDHADVVSEYHAAHDISLLNTRRQASTEQLREAMVHYRVLFAELLDGGGSSTDHAAADNVPGR